jgi:hypothetical protein
MVPEAFMAAVAFQNQNVKQQQFETNRGARASYPLIKQPNYRPILNP